MLIVQIISIIRGQKQWTEDIVIEKTLNKSMDVPVRILCNDNTRMYYPLPTTRSPTLQNGSEYVCSTLSVLSWEKSVFGEFILITVAKNYNNRYI